MEEPMTNINVTMTIPSQKYMAASMEVMDGYGDVVKEALEEVKERLATDERFKERVKSVVRDRLQDAVEKAVVQAAERCVRETYRNSEARIEKVVREAILSGMKGDGTC
jgi:predicted transcriptional regulator